MDKSVWRFKTKKEFIQEYGDNWRGIVGWNNTNTSSMDKVLGRFLTNEEAFIILSEEPKTLDDVTKNSANELICKRLGIKHGSFYWFFNKHMIINSTI